MSKYRKYGLYTFIDSCTIKPSSLSVVIHFATVQFFFVSDIKHMVAPKYIAHRIVCNHQKGDKTIVMSLFIITFFEWSVIIYRLSLITKTQLIICWVDIIVTSRGLYVCIKDQYSECGI